MLSLSAAFELPLNAPAMKAMLEHSKQNFGPLPSELRPHRVRSRTSSRPSPYPLRPRAAPDQSRSTLPGKPFASPEELFPAPAALQEISVHHNISLVPQERSFDGKPFFSSAADAEPSKVEKSALGVPRPRVKSGVKRPTVGLSKRGTGKTSKPSASKTSTSSDKENVSQSVVIT